MQTNVERVAKTQRLMDNCSLTSQMKQFFLKSLLKKTIAS